MISYKLAKELKDAGFRQDGRSGIFVYAGAFTGNNEATRSYVPTLEELIEACGDGLIGLLRVLKNSIKDEVKPNAPATWHAKGHMWSGAIYGTGLSETGSTPDEAVALLWLALNKQHDA
jgi:hypothetical protein